MNTQTQLYTGDRSPVVIRKYLSSVTLILCLSTSVVCCADTVVQTHFVAIAHFENIKPVENVFRDNFFFFLSMRSQYWILLKCSCVMKKKKKLVS